jgi:hypothetical protein
MLAQQLDEQERSQVDSLQNPAELSTYGLRLGVGLGKPLRTAIDDRYEGFQVMADYRLLNNWYIAGEIGAEQIEKELESVDFATSGAFFKVGMDYNFYDNWPGTEHMIYAGLRVGSANFSSELTRYSYYSRNQFYPIPDVTTDQSFNGLFAVWAELQVGVKVEVLNNLYITGNLQLKRMLTESEVDNFDNLWVPGFGKTYDTGEIGVGYSYGVAYVIPLFKR